MCYIGNGERKDCEVSWHRNPRWSSYKVIIVKVKSESYKYLRILEADKFLEEKMTFNVSKEHMGRLRKVLKSKLKGRNLVSGVNTWAVSLLKYSAAFVGWSKSEIQPIDRRTRNLFTMY